MKSLLVVLLLCLAAPRLTWAGGGSAEDIAAVSRLRGAPVTTPSGVALGSIGDVLLDLRPKGVHYALLEVPAGSPGAPPKRFAYPVSALQAGPTPALLLDVRPENLRIAPGYENRAWPDEAFRDDSRYVLGSALLGAPGRDALGNPVARVADVLISLRTGRTERVIFDFDDSTVLSLPAHAIRLRADGAVILGDSSRRAALAKRALLSSR
jgi:sporulation protein YlmC with PRC-barrel domain